MGAACNGLLITREVTDDPEPYEVGERLSARLEWFLLLTRLLTAGTVLSTYEVTGTTTLISRMEPLMGTFRKGWFDLRVRRTVRLTGEEGEAFAALGGLIDAADVKREGMSATSLDAALGNYNRSHSSDSPYEHLVDLATALEAALIGAEKETEGLTLRLRNRAAALLVTDDDPAKTLFEDVGSSTACARNWCMAAKSRTRVCARPSAHSRPCRMMPSSAGSAWPSATP
jgi:hypothetical protein